MNAFLETLTTGPALVAAVPLSVCCLYWLVVLVGGLGFDFLDIDLDFETGADAESALSVGMVALKWLNLGNVPIMIWMSVFSLSFWVFCVVVPWFSYYGNWWALGGVVTGGMAGSVLVTKLLTEPLKGKFDPKEPTTTDELIGRMSIIKTPEATRTSGQAEVRTDAAPLLLNVRTVQGVLAKGDEARIVDYDDEAKAYLVEIVASKDQEQNVV